jgi:hypothetical protein
MLGAGNVRTARGGQIASQPPTTRHEGTFSVRSDDEFLYKQTSRSPNRNRIGKIIERRRRPLVLRARHLPVIGFSYRVTTPNGTDMTDQ